MTDDKKSIFGPSDPREARNEDRKHPGRKDIPGDRSYKRRWKNLLLNKRYQLRFTLFMVGLAALLMTGLGIWVMWVANETTTVSMSSVRGEACPKIPTLRAGAHGHVDEEPVPVPSMRLEEPTDGATGDTPAPAAAPGETPVPEAPAPSAPADPPAVPAADAPATPPAPAPVPAHDPAADRAAGAAATDAPERRANVQLDESVMTLTTPVPPDLADRIVAHWTCELRQLGTFAQLERGRLRILWVLIATGVLLVLGLAGYGLKMTHRVAGPLFKVSLYLGKMRAGRFDKVYNLRKGDQLVEFYDHFKLAHGGIVATQREDITRIAAVIAAAEAAGLSSHPAIAELRVMLERKEKSIE